MDVSILILECDSPTRFVRKTVRLTCNKYLEQYIDESLSTFVYVFRNGLREFEEKTATMDLVSSSMFRKRNILIFFVHEQDVSSMTIPFEKEIQEGLDSLLEGE
jgi:hypothetical protein